MSTPVDESPTVDEVFSRPDDAPLVDRAPVDDVEADEGAEEGWDWRQVLLWTWPLPAALVALLVWLAWVWVLVGLGTLALAGVLWRRRRARGRKTGPGTAGRAGHSRPGRARGPRSWAGRARAKLGRKAGPGRAGHSGPGRAGHSGPGRAGPRSWAGRARAKLGRARGRKTGPGSAAGPGRARGPRSWAGRARTKLGRAGARARAKLGTATTRARQAVKRGPGRRPAATKSSPRAQRAAARSARRTARAAKAHTRSTRRAQKARTKAAKTRTKKPKKPGQGGRQRRQRDWSPVWAWTRRAGLRARLRAGNGWFRVATVVGDEVRSGRWPKALLEPLDGLFPDDRPSTTGGTVPTPRPPTTTHRTTSTGGSSVSTAAVASRNAMSADEQTYRDLAAVHTAEADKHEQWANSDRAELRDLEDHQGTAFSDRMDELVENIRKHVDAESEFRGKARAALLMADRAAANDKPE